jgi:hypothetical protein
MAPAHVSADGGSSGARKTAARTKSSVECLAARHLPLAQKVVISSGIVQKQLVTKVEGIPAHFRLDKLLNKMKAQDVLSHGGHVAKDEGSELKFLVLPGNVAAAVAAFLVQEGVTNSGSIVQSLSGG